MSETTEQQPPAWMHFWMCNCGIERLRLPWTRCKKCEMKCPEPNGGDPWPTDEGEEL